MHNNVTRNSFLKSLFNFDAVHSLKYIFKEWTDFYMTDTYEKHQLTGSKLSSASTSYYVNKCGFIELSNRAIEFLSATAETRLLTENTIFSKCSNSDVVGALFFENNGQCIQNRICSYQSKSGSNTGEKGGIYCFVDVSDKNPYQNKILDSTIVESGAGTSTGYANILLVNGAANITSVNETRANTNAYCIHRIYSINSESCVKYSTFADNMHKGSLYSPAYYHGVSSPINNLYIQNCNFKNTSSFQEFIYCYDLYSYITNCNFIQCKGNSYSLGQYSSGQMTVDNCYFDEYKSKIGSVNIIKTLNYQTDQHLYHLSTFVCEAQNPLQTKHHFVVKYGSYYECHCFMKIDKFLYLPIIANDYKN